MTARLWIWAPVLAQMAAIFIASSQPDVPSLPGGLSGYTGHFIGYGLLGALALRAFAGATWTGVTTSGAWRAVIFSSAYGVTDELHQALVPPRTPSFGDWIADTAGAAAAVLLVMWLARLRARRRASRDV